MRVLLVEDDEAVLSFVRSGLLQEGFSVDASTEGRDGLQRAVDEPYDAIVHIPAIVTERSART
jgi:DNA-binding response OmpR family regulator